jgi:hypothetical protein
MECYVIGDVTIKGWGLRQLNEAYAEAAAQALSGDVTIEKRDGEEVICTMNVEQTAPKPPRKGHVDVPKEHRKNFGA